MTWLRVLAGTLLLAAALACSDDELENLDTGMDAGSDAGSMSQGDCSQEAPDNADYSTAVTACSTFFNSYCTFCEQTKDGAGNVTAWLVLGGLDCECPAPGP